MGAHYLLEKTEAGLWRVTSPDDFAIHVVAGTPEEAFKIAIACKEDLDRLRAIAPKEPRP